MSQKLCATTYKRHSIVLRLSLLGGIALVLVALGNTGCEDQKIGLPCDVGSAADKRQNEFNDQALECPSRICLKPAEDPNSSMPTPATTALCSAPCSQDSDCDGQLRDPSDKTGLDLRCQKGFACGIVFVKSRIACQKLCVCRDFLNSSGVSTPPGC
jgi:hypothetical protein